MNARFLAGIVLMVVLVAGTVAQPYAAARYSIPSEITDLINEGKLAEARQSLREFRKKNPGNPLAIFYLAQIEDDSNLARALLKEVELLGDPNLASEARYARAEMCIAEGNFPEAETLLLKTVGAQSSGPRYADALYQLGAIRFIAGKPDEALPRFIKSRDALKPGFRKTLASAGIMECRVAKKDWKGALDAAQEVMEGEDDTSALTPRVLEVIALAWHKLGDEENSTKFTRRLLANFPRSYQAHVLRTNGGRIAGESVYSLDRGDVVSDSERSKIRAWTSDAGAGGAQAGGGPSGGENGFSIQVAALEVRLNALKLYNKLKDAGFPARIEMKTIGDKHCYLIRVGTFNSRAEADNMLVRIAKETGVSGGVVIVK